MGVNVAKARPLLSFALMASLAFTGCLNLGTASTAADESSAAASGAASEQSLSGNTAVSPVNDANTTAKVGDANQTSAAAAGIASTAAAQNNNTADAIVPVTGAGRYTLVGRFNLSNPNIIPFTFLSSKMGVRFTGTSIAMDLAGNTNDGFNIVLDDNQLAPLMIKASSATRYIIANNLAPETHTLWLTKRAEFSQGGTNTITLSNMVLDSNATFMTPPPAKTRHIVSIGDSGIAAYGVEGVPPCTYTIATQNADLAVPAQVAKALDAEITNLSWSGEGVVASQYDTNPEHTLPTVYDELVGNDTTRAYDFNTTHTDVVIIDAGSDDFIGASGSGTVADPNKFITVYANWLVHIRHTNPNALLVACVGASSQLNDRASLIQYLTQAKAQANTTLGAVDPNIIVFDYFGQVSNGWTTYTDVGQTGGYGWGCSYHPSATGAAWLANQMYPIIGKHMGWLK